MKVAARITKRRRSTYAWFPLNEEVVRVLGRHDDVDEWFGNQPWYEFSDLLGLATSAELLAEIRKRERA